MRWVVLLSLPLFLGCGGPSPVSVDLLWDFPALYLAPVDLNGDSTDEFLVCGSQISVVGRDQQMLVASRSQIFDSTSSFKGPPGGADSAHLWVFRAEGDSVVVRTLWGCEGMLLFRLPESLPPTGWDGSPVQAEAADLDGDGSAELVVAVEAGYARRPRSIIALDWLTGRTKWQYDMGPNPHDFYLVDVDSDGQTEVLLGSAAPANGNQTEDEQDWITYAYCLGGDGILRWRIPLGSYGQSAVVTRPVRSAGRDPALVVWEYGHPIPGAEPDSIFLLDASTGSIRHAAQVGRHGRGAAVLPVGRDDFRVVTVGSDDTLRLYNSNLKPLRKLPICGNGATGIAAGSYSHCGAQEFAVTTIDGKVVLYDSRLLQIGRGPVTQGGMRALRSIRSSDRSRLLVQVTRESGDAWQLYGFTRDTPLLQRPVPLALLIGSAAFFAFIVAALVLSFQHFRTRDVRAVVRGLTGAAGVIELNRSGTVKRINPTAREMLGPDWDPRAGILGSAIKSTLQDRVGSPPRELPALATGGRTVFARLVRIRSGALLTIEDITAVEYLRRVQSWVPVAQKLAHGIKNPLTAIGLTLQRLERQCGPESVGHVESMKDDVDRLRRMAGSFMRFTKMEPPKFEPGDLNKLIRDCVGRFESVRPTGVELKLELADVMPPVLYDSAQLSEACANVVENAIAAIGESGKLTVRSAASPDGKSVTVSFADTGPGIPERYLAKVFEPYFTQKPGGTGLGMAITKRIVEDHKGSVSVRSTEGKGTTVTFELPATGTDAA